MNRASSTRLQKDAIIALVILILLLLLWRLMTRPEQWGGAGNWAREHVFGLSGVRLAESLGQDNTGAPSPVPVGPGNSASGSNTVPPATPAAPAAPAPATPPDNAGPAPTNSADKIIAGFDTNDLSPPLANSPDAAAIAKRLSDAGARGGDIEFSLFWGNYNDLDLHCIDPKGVEIYFSNLQSALTGGRLDVDRNASLPFTNAPIENIFWPAGGAPPGIYQVGVVFYAKHDVVDATRYTVRTVVKEKTNYFTGTISYTGPQKARWICRIQFDPRQPDPAYRCRFLPVADVPLTGR
jgi:hypothetical protein